MSARCACWEMIRVEEFGEPDGKPVLVRQGARDHGGCSGRTRSWRIVDAITDIRCIAGALGIQRMGIWGSSGGSCYSLVCAAMLPELVTGAVVFASFAPYGLPGLDFCEGKHWRQDTGRLSARSWEVACGGRRHYGPGRAREQR